MKYVDDWVKMQERFKAFWANDIVDQCCVKVTAPRENTKYKVFDRSDLRKFWTDPQCVLERHEDFFEKTFFGGEAFPKIWVNLGPGITSAYLGCEVNFSENTIWFKPFINDWETDTFFNISNCTIQRSYRSGGIMLYGVTESLRITPKRDSPHSTTPSCSSSSGWWTTNALISA